MSKIKVNEIDKRNGSTLTLGGCGTAVTLASGATQTGFGRTGTVDWDTTPKTATFTAVSGDGFFANTTSSAFTMNLPAGSAGAIVSVADYAGTWQNNALTVVPNGSDKIGGTNANVTLNTEGQSVTFIFVDSTQGWVNVQDSTSNERAQTFISASGGNSCATDGVYKYHTFTGPGTFTVSSISATPANNVVDYLVVGAGGGGGGGTPNWTMGGGGGAGGYRTFVSNPTTSPKNAPAGITVSVQAYPITVGGGGAGGPGDNNGSSGNTATFSTITSAGGGGGGAYSTPKAATTGGSGGGGTGGSACTPNTSGAAGNTPPVSPPQGNTGGNGNRAFQGPNYYQNFAGGGGGANAVGGNAGPAANCSTGGNGGAGEPNYITGSNVTYAGGGGGAGAGVDNGPGSANPIPGGGGTGGAGGGGAGITVGRTANGIPWSPGSTGGAGSDNTGGGGGGGGANGDSNSPEFGTSGGAGGSGIVIIRYKNA